MTKTNGQMSKEIYLAGGCFWGAEHFLKQIEGVEATEVGYANGHTDRPTYEEVCTDKTGFAETVRVVYDPARIGLAFLLDLYFKAIDPTSVNQQGGDRGTQYRTGIYYVDEADAATIDQVLADQQQAVGEPLAVEHLPLRNFYPTRTTWRRTPRATAICLPPSSSWRARPSPSPPTTNAIQKAINNKLRYEETDLFPPLGLRRHRSGPRPDPAEESV